LTAYEVMPVPYRHDLIVVRRVPDSTRRKQFRNIPA